MKKYIFLLLFGLATMIGGCVPFGLSIQNAINVNEALQEKLTINKNTITSFVTENTKNYILPAINIHLTSTEIDSGSMSRDEEYSAKYRFPVKMIITDNLDNIIYQYKKNLSWDRGSRSYDLNDVNSRKGEVIVEIDFDKISVPSDGEIKIEVLLADDTFYYANIVSAKLIIYDNVHKYTKMIVTGVVIIILGITIFIIGVIMLILVQTRANSSSRNNSNNMQENGGNMSQDNESNYEKTVNTENDLDLKAMNDAASTTASKRSSINTTAMLCHLSTFAGFIIPLGGILGPLIMWQIKKDEDPFINRHGIAALNFHLSMAIYYFVSFLLAFIVIGFFFLIILAITELVLVIIASVKASNGEEYRYPLTITFIAYPAD